MKQKQQLTFNILPELKRSVNGAIDYLHHKLITEFFKNKKYFDFGISNENQGRNINKGLLFWKEGFGARSVSQDFYRLPLENINLLENVFI